MFPPFLSGPLRVQPLLLLVSSSHAMPPRPIGRRCQDSARQRPRQEIKCSTVSLSVALFRFSLFVANSHTKRFRNIVLDLTYLLSECVCHLFPAWLRRNSWLLHFGPLRRTSFGWVCPILFQICAVIAMQHYFQLAAPPFRPPFLFPVRQAPYQVSGHFPPTGYRASCRASFS